MSFPDDNLGNRRVESVAKDGLVRRLVSIGGLNKQQLLGQLIAAGVELNEYARSLFTSDKFTTLPTSQPLMTVEVTVRQLDFVGAATSAEIYERARGRGWFPSPIELGAHLRLQYLDQLEGYWGYPVTQQCAPPGAITVAARPLTSDNTFPKGFYLRRIKGVLWLRGYCCDQETPWNLDDRFIFYESASQASR